MTHDNLYDAILMAMPPDVKVEIVKIYQEYERACEMHKEWPMDFIHAAAIVAEESGELIQASLQNHYDGHSFENMKTEAVQTGAMALRFMVNANGWWCWACKKLVPVNEVTPGKRHDEDQGGCGCYIR